MDKHDTGQTWDKTNVRRGQTLDRTFIRQNVGHFLKLNIIIMAQLISTNAFSVNTFSLNVLSTFTAIYSQSIVNTNTFLKHF